MAPVSRRPGVCVAAIAVTRTTTPLVSDVVERRLCVPPL